MKQTRTINLFSISILIALSTQLSFAQSGSITINADPQIEKLLLIKKDLEKDNEGDGYTIQLYYGELEKANSIQKKYRSIYGTWPASIEYETPNFKVWVGSFTSRLEADRALMEIEKNFGTAFILKKKKDKK
jgi:hypothetical protein